MCIAFPVQIVELRNGTALVARDTRRFEVGRLFVPEAKVGDWALVHSSQLVSIVAPDELEPLQELLRELSTLGDEPC